MRVQITIDDAEESVSVSHGEQPAQQEIDESQQHQLSGDKLAAGRASDARTETGFNPAGLPPSQAGQPTQSGVQAEQMGLPLDVAHSMSEGTGAGPSPQSLPHGQQQQSPRAPRRGQTPTEGEIFLGNEY